MLKFRKIEFLLVKKSVFHSISDAQQAETSISGPIFRGEKGRKWRIFRQMRHFCVLRAAEPDQCATGENKKKSSASVQQIRRLEARKRPLFRAKIS